MSCTSNEGDEQALNDLINGIQKKSIVSKSNNIIPSNENKKQKKELKETIKANLNDLSGFNIAKTKLIN